jgi:G3E family GTPase
MIPFSVIGGFLGAGKTTLINRLIRRPRMPRLAILVNDFGDIAIDEALLETHGGDTIALKNGCICCSIGNDLSRALGRVLDSEAPVEHIVVEASGVANPGRIMDLARLSSELEPAGVLVVVDAAALPAQLGDRWIADTVAAQLASADRFFVNRLETVDAETCGIALEHLTRDYPDVEQVQDPDAAWHLITATGADDNRQPDSSPVHLRFCSRSLISDRVLDPDRLKAWLSARDDVYRIKGWARLAQGDTRLLQYAGGQLHWASSESETLDETRLVVIGRGELPSTDAILAAITVGDTSEAFATGFTER